MRFGVIANFERPDASKAVEFIAEWCKKNNHESFLCTRATRQSSSDAEKQVRQQLCEDADLVISLGGDGTMLATARILGGVPIPILGINLGSLGFLTQLTPDNLEDAMQRLVDESYQIEDRMVLNAEVLGGVKLPYPYSLNDIVIDKGNVSRVINLSLYADGEYISSYTADGIIIATPTGSTAYSLAVGGPILKPNMQALIASPISPFSLTSRPLVFTADTSLEIRIRSEHGNAHLTIDGQIATEFSPTGTVRITKADHTVKFIKFAENSFFNVLRRKLHWGKQPVVDYKKADYPDEPKD